MNEYYRELIKSKQFDQLTAIGDKLIFFDELRSKGKKIMKHISKDKTAISLSIHWKV